MKRLLFICSTAIALCISCTKNADKLLDTNEEPDTPVSSLSEQANSSSSIIQESSSSLSLPGMALVQANGKGTILGTNISDASVHDKPSMNVSFSYDFFIGTHETTCSEMQLQCADSLPATNVTYYDAILYANNRSKAEGFDTSYTYTNASFKEDGSCTDLEGLVFHPEINAYRLPTEAEWVFVASQNFHPENGWNSTNSGYALHKICTANNVSEICDMAGNAAEWVNDWMVYFRDTTINNYIGGIDGGSRGERIVKGGSYTNSATATNLYTRGDIYTVNSAAKSDYIGFRLAFGSIPKPNLLSQNGSVPSLISILVGQSTLKNAFGLNGAKLAFRNDITGNLNYIDFSGSNPRVIEIADSLSVYHPEISPDGMKVAFCTGMEGTNGTSEIYVRNLSENGGAIRKLNVHSAAIPRWRIIENADTTITFVTNAMNNNDPTWEQTQTWNAIFENKNFGELGVLTQGAYNGGISEDGTLAVTGSQKLKALVNGIPQVWYNGEQACNVSLSQGGAKYTLFLDFGGETGRSFAGENYKAHERALIADSLGNLIKSIKAPSGYTFDHTEWVRGSDSLFVATLVNINGAHSKIVLVNTQTENIVSIVEGEELWHPCLWVKQDIYDETLSRDSAGVYLVPGADNSHEVISTKMKLFWNHYQDIEYLLVGNSRVEAGIFPDSITSGYSLNMGHPSNSLDFTIYLSENYGFIHAKKLKAVVVSLDFDSWRTLDYTHTYVIPGYPGYTYDANHNFWKDSLPKNFIKAVNYAYSTPHENYLTFEYNRGLCFHESLSWGEPLVSLDSTWASLIPDAIPTYLKDIRSFLSHAKERGVYVVGVLFPQNPKYKETGAWGRYGPRRSEIPAIMDSLASMQNDFPNFKLMDENKMGDHDYPDSLASDTDHLSTEGAYKLTKRLDSLLKTLEPF